MDVAQILVGNAVVGVVAHGRLQGRAGLVELVLACVDDGQVVVGLGQLGVVLDELVQRGDGLVGLATVSQGHGLEKAHLGVACVLGKIGFGACQGLGALPLRSNWFTSV